MAKRNELFSVAQPAADDITLSQSPMYSADGQEIKVNMVLYRGSYSGGNYFRGECKADIEALRVFYVSNQHRQFRVRSIKGCEETIRVTECGTHGMFSSVGAVKEYLREKFEHDLDKCRRKKESVQKTEVKIRDVWIALKAKDEKSIRTPKAVK